MILKSELSSFTLKMIVALLKLYSRVNKTRIIIIIFNFFRADQKIACTSGHNQGGHTTTDRCLSDWNTVFERNLTKLMAARVRFLSDSATAHCLMMIVDFIYFTLEYRLKNNTMR